MQLLWIYLCFGSGELLYDFSEAVCILASVKHDTKSSREGIRLSKFQRYWNCICVASLGIALMQYYPLGQSDDFVICTYPVRYAVNINLAP